MPRKTHVLHRGHDFSRRKRFRIGRALAPELLLSFRMQSFFRTCSAPEVSPSCPARVFQYQSWNGHPPSDSALRLLRIARCQASRFQFSVAHSEEAAAFLH